MTECAPSCKVLARAVEIGQARSATSRNTTSNPEYLMKYLCLIYGDEKSRDTMSAEDGARMRKDYMAFTEDIRKSGHYLGGNALQPTSTATTIRSRNGSLTTTDGPFAETREHLGGYYLVEARDLNDAIQVAGRIPGARFGSIEVRPIMEMS